jgi:hypothetical protein
MHRSDEEDIEICKDEMEDMTATSIRYVFLPTLTLSQTILTLTILA